MSKKYLPLSLLLSLCVMQTYPWWDAGHMVIAQIARNLLNKDVKKKLDALIEASNDKSAPHCNTFVTASTWSDVISSHMRAYWDFHSQAYPFFSNDDELISNEDLTKFIRQKMINGLMLDEQQLEEKESDNLIEQKINSLTEEEYSTLKKEACSKIKSDAYNKNRRSKLISGLNAFIQTLKSKKAPDKIKGEALRWVIHLVGDIHQPLHCITRYSSQFKYGDFLGCRVKVTPPKTLKNKEPKSTSLHRVWDSGGCVFPEHGFRLPLDETQKAEIKKMAYNLSIKYPGGDKLPGIKKPLKPFDWAVESSNLAKKFSYKGVEHNGNLSRQYMKTCKSICNRRMALAGHRLAMLLNNIFADKKETKTTIPARVKRKRKTSTDYRAKRRKLNPVKVF